MYKINIIIPMVGEDTKFSKLGFKNIKPLIPLNGKTIIEWSIDSVDFKDINTQFIFIIQEKHKEKLYIFLKKIKPNCIILTVEKLINGVIETALIAKNYVNNDIPLIITNCDQILEWNKQKYLQYLQSNNIDGNVVRVKETTDKLAKKIISENALVGIYYWTKGSYFVRSGKELIRQNIPANNDISLTYNMIIKDNLKISSYILKDNEKYLSVRTPEKLYNYLNYKNLNVEINKLSNFKRGWIIGNFEPSLLKNTGVELAIMKEKKGIDYGGFHYHEKCTEINILIKGKIKINDKIVNPYEIFIFKPYVPAICELLEDSEWVVFKNKNSKNDKVIM